MSEGRYTRIEAVDVARQLEACGEAFYDAARKHARDGEVEALLRHLRDEERAHSRAFDALLAGIEEAQGDWRADPAYETWMRAFAVRRVFPDPEHARSQVERLDDRGLLGLAIRFEQQTIEFLEQLRSQLAPGEEAVIDTLIAEERQHERLLRARVERLHG